MMKNPSDSIYDRQSNTIDGLLILQALCRGGTVTELARRLSWHDKKVRRMVYAMKSNKINAPIETSFAQRDSGLAPMRFKLDRNWIINFFK